MKCKTAQRNGSAILWAVLVMLMISLISAGIILVDRMYFMREQEENNRLQAKLYAESAIELVQSDICKEGQEEKDEAGNPKTDASGNPVTYQSVYVSESNTAVTYTISFPDAGNWTCTVTVNHSVVNLSSPRTTGEIYLTAKVTRKTTGKDKNGSTAEKELAEICAKMKAESGIWQPAVYYHL